MLFKKAKIMVIGDLMIDHYVYGTVERISPEASVPILEKEGEDVFLGGAGLTATSLTNLGANVDFVSVIGDDDESTTARRLLSGQKLSSEDIVVETGRKTTVKKRFIATSPYFQMLLRVDNESRENIQSETEQDIIEKIKKRSEDAEFIVISDYNKGLLTKNIIDTAIEIGKNKKIIVDSKKSLYDYKGAYLVTPNIKELCLAFGLKATNDDDLILSSAIKLSRALGSKVIVKRGAKGATIIDENGTRSYPSAAKNVVNVSGAGDIFVAVLTMALASGKGLEDAVKLANLGCGHAISKKHPAISLEDFERGKLG